MSMIDLKNLEKLSPEQRAQFSALLEQFPHLDSKMSTSRELNTPTKLEEEKHFVTPPSAAQVNDEVDYTNFTIPQAEGKPNKDLLPKMKINPLESSFSSLEDVEKPLPPDAQKTKEIEEARKAQRVKAGVASGQPYEVASFSDEGKVHPVLHKLRATVGMRSMQKPVVVNVGGCNYSMRPLDRSSLTNATALAMSTTPNSILLETSIENAIIAFSVVAVDNVPLYDVFSIPTHDAPIGDPHPVALTQLQREEKAAEAFYMELLRSPNELVEALGVYYQQEFPPLVLLGADKAKFLCPESNCLQSRIADRDEDCFCPVHGVKMAREDRLPNPS